MTDEEKGRDQAVQALAAGLAAMHDELVERNLLEPGKVASRLRRVINPDQDYYQVVEMVARLFDPQEGANYPLPAKPHLTIVRNDN